MKFMRIFLFIFWGSQIWAQHSLANVAAENSAYVMCRSHSVVRTIRILKTPSGFCEATYTKDGVDQQVARSSKLEACKTVLERIRSNLEKAQWSCKDISQARVSSESKD